MPKPGKLIRSSRGVTSHQGARERRVQGERMATTEVAGDAPSDEPMKRHHQADSFMRLGNGQH